MAACAQDSNSSDAAGRAVRLGQLHRPLDVPRQARVKLGVPRAAGLLRWALAAAERLDPAEALEFAQELRTLLPDR